MCFYRNTALSFLFSCVLLNPLIGKAPSSNSPSEKDLSDNLCGYISGDYLYWTARQDALEYAYDGAASSSSASASVSSKGQVKFPRWNWTSGFRIGVGYYSQYDHWDVFAEYTWFRTSIIGQAIAGDSALKKIWSPVNFNTQNSVSDNLASAFSSWDLKFHTMDLCVGKDFSPSHKVSLFPFFGLKGTWQDQNYNITYNVLGESTPQKPVSSAMIRQSQNYWGVGVLAGTQARWYFWKYLSLYGKLAFSALWEEFHVERTDDNYSNEEIITLWNSKRFGMAEPVIETAIGLEGNYWFSSKKMHLILLAGYEYQIWLDQNQFTRVTLTTTGNGGNLTLQGLTIKAKIEF